VLPSPCATRWARGSAVLMLCSIAAPGWANVIPNIGEVGPYGNPVTANAPGGDSAALDWYAFLCSPRSTATSELLPTTDPAGGGLMMDFTTNGGFAGSCGNGL
jgi:hypothetical protein